MLKDVNDKNLIFCDTICVEILVTGMVERGEHHGCKIYQCLCQQVSPQSNQYSRQKENVAKCKQ